MTDQHARAADGTESGVADSVENPVENVNNPVDGAASGPVEIPAEADGASDPAASTDSSSTDSSSADASSTDSSSADSTSTESTDPAPGRQEEEGDIAADYVEELLDIADLDGDIDIEVRQGRTYVSVLAENDDDGLRDFVGKDGKGLEALQELTRLAVLASTGNRSRLVLDIAGHRAERAGHLDQLAQDAVQRVREGETAVHLDPMGAYERKIVHDVVADAGLLSESEGEGSRRHVVVSAGD